MHAALLRAIAGGEGEGSSPECRVCRAPAIDDKGMAVPDTVVHHAWYGTGCPTHGTYGNRLDYWRALAEYARTRASPGELIILCKRHHYAVERALRWGDDAWLRISEIVVESRCGRLRMANARNKTSIKSAKKRKGRKDVAVP